MRQCSLEKNTAGFARRKISPQIMRKARDDGENIICAVKENGSPKPEFETDADHSYFISRIFVHEAFLKENGMNDSQKGAEKKNLKK